MTENYNVEPLAIENPVCSTDEVWYKDNQEISASQLFDGLTADVAALETGKANTSHTHTEYAASSHSHTGYAASSHTHSEYAASNHEHTNYATSDHTHDYAAADHTHTGFAADTHDHDADYIAKALQIVADNGGVALEMAGQDITATISALGTGVKTGYCPVNSTNAPNANEAWRFLIHKTGATYGWVIGFGSYGSVYTNYLNDGTWRGWKNLVDGTSNPLWYDNGSCVYLSNTDTVTPSKALNQCNNGWVLVWSDSDTDGTTVNNADICTTVIPKRNTVGALWGGQSMLCPIAGYQAVDTDSDVIRIKRVYVHNDKLVGHAANAVGNRCDIALRAVYEY